MGKGKYELQKRDIQTFLPIRDVIRLIHDIFLLHRQLNYLHNSYTFLYLANTENM